MFCIDLLLWGEVVKEGDLESHDLVRSIGATSGPLEIQILWFFDDPFTAYNAYRSRRWTSTHQTPFTILQTIRTLTF